MSARELVQNKVRLGQLDELAALATADPRTLRHLLALTYRSEAPVRAAAARAIATASHHHPELVQEMARRLVWAMNDESGANGLNAPEVLHEIGRSNPELLLPLLPDLLRLSADPGLHDRLVEVSRLVAAHDRRRAATTVATALCSCARGGKS